MLCCRIVVTLLWGGRGVWLFLIIWDMSFYLLFLKTLISGNLLLYEICIFLSFEIYFFILCKIEIWQLTQFAFLFVEMMRSDHCHIIWDLGLGNHILWDFINDSLINWDSAIITALHYGFVVEAHSFPNIPTCKAHRCTSLLSLSWRIHHSSHSNNISMAYP